MRFVVLIFGLVSALGAACLPITTDRIYGRDLVAAEPRLSTLPPELAVGFAPQPSGKRVFTSADLARIARLNSIPGDHFSEICFELPMHAPRAEEILSAMRAVLPAGSDLQILAVPAAAIPDAKAKPATPPSNEAIARSNAKRVGLWLRP